MTITRRNLPSLVAFFPGISNDSLGATILLLSSLYSIRLVIRKTPFVKTTSMKIKRDALRAELEQATPRPKTDRRRR